MNEESKIKLFEIASHLVLQDAKEHAHPSDAVYMAEQIIIIYRKLKAGFLG